ncbi:MAG: hypothetical protein JNK33_01135 [Candidatus Doudnabacteria bacterium]|nr:hypothetical protein [Candidatus Doudnabacteria bacterium]
MKYEFRIKAGVIAALFFALSVHASAAQAAGIEVSPARLEMSVGNKPVTSRIQVKNPTSDVQLYEVSLNTDDSSIGIRPKSFTVQAGGSQEVQIRVEPKDSAEFSGEVQVVGRPLAATSNEIGSGVKLPLAIHYGAHSVWYQQSLTWIAFILLVALVVCFVGRSMRKK